MKKILAVLLTITAPVWFLPVAILFILAMGFSQSYKEIYRLLEKKWL
jgi:hypothetical protein